MRNSFRWMLVSCATMLSGLALAESTSEALTRIETETLLLKARERQLEAQANVLAKQNEIALKQGANGTLQSLVSGHEPVVRGIEGMGGKMYATLEAGGAVFDVKTGDVMPNGMRVLSVGANGVVVRTKFGKSAHLAIAASGSPANALPSGNGNANPSFLPLPPLAPVPSREVAR